MKESVLMFLLLLLLGGCGAPMPTAMPTALPTFVPIALAQTTNAPTPTRNPNAAALPTMTRAPSATVAVPASATAAPTQVPPRQAPTILTRFNLLDLPGEGRAPVALALRENRVYVANRGSANIGILENERVREFIKLDVNPTTLVADPTQNRLYVGTYETPTLYLIENERVVKQVRVQGPINALALHGDALYVALDSNAIILRYNAHTLVQEQELRLSKGFGVSALAVDPTRNRLYAAVYGALVALDLREFQELFLLDAPYLYSDFALHPQDGSLWAGAYDDQSSRAYVVGYSSEGQELARLFVGADLRATTFDFAGRLYLMDRYNNQVHVVQTPHAELVATIPVNQAPIDAVFDAARERLYVANQENDNVSVVDTVEMRVVTTLALASQITAMEANPTLNRVYVVNAATNQLYAIQGTIIVGQAKTGNGPVDIALDAQTNRLYVASIADGMLTMFDENSLEIVATQFITRFLSTTAMDSPNHKLFAANYTLDPTSLLRDQIFFAQGLTLGSQSIPRFERANPALRKLYAIASNGVPGSNARLTLYRFLYDNLAESKFLGSRNGGNVTALAIDPTTNNLFAANSHPLAYTHGLDVWDAQDNLVQSLALASHTPALVVNPTTHHLFLAHAQTYAPYLREPKPRDNTIDILDTRTLGHVTTLNVDGDPWRMTRLNDEIYVGGYRDGSITLIGDAVTNQPPAPTPTLTPTPYPSWTFTPPPQATSTPAAAATPQPSSSTCAIEIAEPLRAKAESSRRAKLGCPLEAAEDSEHFAYQALERGFLYADSRDENAKQVIAFFPNNTYRVFGDTWGEGDAEQTCAPYVRPGLYLPKRGFGLVWCNEPEVQALGGGLAEERAVLLTMQKFERGKMWFVPDIGAVILYDDGTWE